MRLWRFFKYNNAVPIVLSLLLLSFGTTLAASPEIRSEVAASVFSSQTRVLSVDNTYIANKDLSSYTPRAIIAGVSEDPEFYYVRYSFNTIDIKNSVWQDVTKDELIKVQKTALRGGDLGLYVTRELRQRIDRELDMLRQTQQIEKVHVSQEVIATVYGGLIGKFLDDTTETLPGYVPVVTPPAAPPSNDSGTGSPQPSSSGDVAPPIQGTGTPPTIQILGNNPSRIDIGVTYSDLGIVVTDSLGHDLGYQIFFDGVKTMEVQLDTRVAGTHTIKYVAVDSDGNTAEATRTVIVGTPPVVSENASSTEATASSSEDTAL